METVPPNPYFVESPRNWKLPGDTRHGTMESRVEAGDLD
jgi:hypothetical protein